MEHLSRRTTNNVDLLCIVAEANPLGTVTAKRIFDLTKQLPISVKQIGVIWNETRGPSDERRATNDELETLGCVPYDDAVFNALMQGKTIFDIKRNNPALAAVKGILEQKLPKVKVGES